jgi:hypothetical protein
LSRQSKEKKNAIAHWGFAPVNYYCSRRCYRKFWLRIVTTSSCKQRVNNASIFPIPSRLPFPRTDHPTHLGTQPLHENRGVENEVLCKLRSHIPDLGCHSTLSPALCAANASLRHSPSVYSRSPRFFHACAVRNVYRTGGNSHIQTGGRANGWGCTPV